MLVRVKEYLKLKRRSKRFMFGFVVFMLSIITGFSYAVFMISTSKYRSSEMFIADLMYGINISSVENVTNINGKQITVGYGTTAVVNVTLTSLNPVDSNYKLQYKIISGTGNVYYSDRTNWMPYGTISKSNEGVYVKTIQVVIENTGTSDLTVELGASGGYSYNSISSVALISGYTAITEEKTTTVAISESEKINEIVESDTSCDTLTNGICLYGGESKNNYVQYPESSNKSENIWRIMGTYNVDGKIVAKMISETSNSSTYTDAVSSLNSFYNTLDNRDDYIYSTNKFLCSGSNINCTTSKYTNIGLINIDEYNKIGGINSYLGSTSSYFSMTENNNLVSNITSNGIEEVEFDTTSGLRGVVYVQEDVKVTGKGTSSDPYTFEEKGEDINIVAWTLNGEKQSGTFPQKDDGYVVSSVTCTDGTIVEWDSINWLPVFKSINVPLTCTINFEVYEAPFMYEQILADNPNVSTRSSFSSIFTTSNNGNTIYKASGQDGKDTYYFAGQVTNNYVYFGGYYWRIVRINEDNSVRLIYAGTSATDTAAFISTSQTYNSSLSNSAYVGYMYTRNLQYGTNTNSAIKTVVDNWYTSNLNSYSGYISKTAIYCNDRTVGSGSWTAVGSTFRYAAYTRLNNKTPTFACSYSNDRFTASTSTGNGKLTYPIGLITADEISYAGGVYGTNNSNYYIAQNASSGASSCWTMSPSYYSSNGYAYVFYVGGSSYTGRLDDNNVYRTNGVRPVISLKSCVLASGGSGTASDPYTVELPSACSSAEN